MSLSDLRTSSAACLVLIAGMMLSASAWAQPTTTNPPAATDTPAKPKIHSRQATVEQMLKIGSPLAPTIAPDGTAFMRERHKGIFQVYRREAGTGPTGKLTRLTDFADGAAGFSLSPDGQTLLIIAAKGGSEQTRVYRMDPKQTEMIGDSTTPILAPAEGGPEAKGGIQFTPTAWLRDASGFFYRANDQQPANFFVYRFDLGTGQRTPVLKEAGAWSASSPSRDGSRIIVTKSLSNTQSEVYELNIATGTRTELTLRDEQGDPASNSVIGYMPGEQAVMILSDIKTGADGLWIRDLKTGEATSAKDALAKLGITSPELDTASMSFEGDLLAIVGNDRGYSQLRVCTLPDFAPVALPAIPEGLVSVAQFRNRRLTVSFSNATTVGVSHAITFDAQNQGSSLEQLTVTDDQGIDLSAFIAPSLVEYTSFDGLKVPAFLYLPEARKVGDGRGPIPFIVDFHGGPEGQHRPGFSRELQVVLDRGYGVLLPNVRGSTGYGRNFQMMDNQRKRWDSVKDGVFAAQWLVEQGLATPGKIVNRGGSYGGFMSVATLIEDTNHAEATKGKNLFGGGINTVGIVNFRTFLEQTADYRRKLREAEYGELTDTDTDHP